MAKRIKIIIILLLGLFVFLVLFIGLEKSNNYSPDNISAKIETKISAKSLYKGCYFSSFLSWHGACFSNFHNGVLVKQVRYLMNR